MSSYQMLVRKRDIMKNENNTAIGCESQINKLTFYARVFDKERET